MDYYIESAEGGEFPEDEGFYDDLNLDEADFAIAGESGSENEDDDPSAPSPKEVEKAPSGPASAVGSPQRKEEKKPAPVAPGGLFAGQNRGVVVTIPDVFLNPRSPRYDLLLDVLSTRTYREAGASSH